MSIQSQQFEPLTAEQFTHLGEGAIAYVRPIKAEQAQDLFPQVQGIKPGMELFALIGANGQPIVLADSIGAAIANAGRMRSGREVGSVPAAFATTRGGWAGLAGFGAGRGRD